MQPGQRRKKFTLNCFRGGNVDGRRDDVIAGLAEIDVIVGMNELTAPSPPNSSVARFEITSLVFMFVEVPEPVLNTSTGN